MEQPLADLIREALKGERLYAVQGNEWYGWWAGHIPGGQQVFVAFGGRSVYYSRWQQITHPELSDPNGGPPTIYLAVFDQSGSLRGVQSKPDPLRIDPKVADSNTPDELDVAELEAFLRREFGGFERATIRVKPFAIPEIGLRLSPLPQIDADFLDAPKDYEEEHQASIREWIEEGSSELLYGNDYYLGEDGEVTSS